MQSIINPTRTCFDKIKGNKNYCVKSMPELLTSLTNLRRINNKDYDIGIFNFGVTLMILDKIYIVILNLSIEVLPS